MRIWRDPPVNGVSHPKEYRRLPPLDMLAMPIGGTTPVIDDVATSGYHMEKALAALCSLGIPAAGTAWIRSGGAATGPPRPAH